MRDLFKFPTAEPTHNAGEHVVTTDDNNDGRLPCNFLKRIFFRYLGMNCKPVGTHVAVGVYSEAETKDTLSLPLWYVFGKRCLAFLTSAVLWMSEVYFLVFFLFFFLTAKIWKSPPSSVVRHSLLRCEWALTRVTF